MTQQARIWKRISFIFKGRDRRCIIEIIGIRKINMIRINIVRNRIRINQNISCFQKGGEQDKERKYNDSDQKRIHKSCLKKTGR